MTAAALALSPVSTASAASTVWAAAESAGPPAWLVGVGTFLALCLLLVIVMQLNRNR